MMLRGMYSNVWAKLTLKIFRNGFFSGRSNQPRNVHINIFIYPTKCSKLMDHFHLTAISISLDPFKPFQTFEHVWACYIRVPFWKAPGPTPEALPPMACVEFSYLRNVKKSRVEEPCRVWDGLNSAAFSAALAHVEKCWKQIMAYATYAWNCVKFHEIAWNCMILHKRWRRESVQGTSGTVSGGDWLLATRQILPGCNLEIRQHWLLPWSYNWPAQGKHDLYGNHDYKQMHCIIIY